MGSPCSGWLAEGLRLSITSRLRGKCSARPSRFGARTDSPPPERPDRLREHQLAGHAEPTPSRRSTYRLNLVRVRGRPLSEPALLSARDAVQHAASCTLPTLWGT